jgi:hypothetical protein
MMDQLLQEMIDPAPARGDRSRWRRLGVTVAILALATVGVTSLTTSALFTDRETTAGDLLTGTVDLSLGSFVFDVSANGMNPGDIVVKPLTVTNSGSLALRYAASFQARSSKGALAAPTGTAVDPTDPEALAGTGDLRNALTLDVFPVATTDDCTTTVPLPADSGTVTGLVQPGEPTLGYFTPILGNAVTTPYTGAFHELATQTSNVLCVRVTFAKDAGNEYQNTTAHIDLRLDAEQVVNNPAPTPTVGG